MPESPELEPEEHAPEHPRFGGLRRRGIYLLPNLFTTGVLFCGFLSRFVVPQRGA